MAPLFVADLGGSGIDYVNGQEIDTGSTIDGQPLYAQYVLASIFYLASNQLAVISVTGATKIMYVTGKLQLDRVSPPAPIFTDFNASFGVGSVLQYQLGILYGTNNNNTVAIQVNLGSNYTIANTPNAEYFIYYLK